MNLSDQVSKAILALKGMFKDDLRPAPPPDATIEMLWDRILELEGLRRRDRPGVEQAAKLIMEDPSLDEIPISMIAEIIREVFGAYGLKCKCSESSIRWYQSQRNLEWNIVRRKNPKLEVLKNVAGSDTESPSGE
jgi:hypothetical protein